MRVRAWPGSWSIPPSSRRTPPREQPRRRARGRPEACPESSRKPFPPPDCRPSGPPRRDSRSTPSGRRASASPRRGRNPNRPGMPRTRRCFGRRHRGARCRGRRTIRRRRRDRWNRPISWRGRGISPARRSRDNRGWYHPLRFSQAMKPPWFEAGADLYGTVELRPTVTPGRSRRAAISLAFS